MPIKGCWEINQDLLFIHLSDGNIITPSAEMIFEVFFNVQQPEFPFQLDDLNKLGILPSRYPMELEGRITVTDESGDISLKFSVSAIRNEINIIIDNFLERDADHIIHDGIWYPFVSGSMDLFKRVLNEIGVLSNGIINLRQYSLLISQKTIPVKDLTMKIADAKSMSRKISDPGLALNFVGDLYPYQTHGYRWLLMILRNKLGCVLADDMGLGKTIQVIAVLTKGQRENYPDLIICPATLITNWIRELKKFTKDLVLLIHRGPERTGFPAFIKNVNIVITSYDTALRDYQLLKMINWNTIVLDEAQAIKNPDALRTQAIKKISRNSLIAMTGTPFENKLMDLWSIMDMANPGILGPKEVFEKNYDNNLKSAGTLEPIISPFILRRTVDEVSIQLPEKIDIPQVLTMSNITAKGYEQLRKKIITKYGMNAGFVSLTYLRMFCTHPLLIDDNLDDMNLESFEKYTRLIEILEEIFNNNRKVLVFTSFRKMIDLMMCDFSRRYGVFCGRIDGGVPVEDRQNIVDIFSEIDRPGVLILNTKAGGTGLNITAANYVIHYNPEWNPATEDQATGRSFRHGQSRTVFVHKLFYENSIEEVIQERLERKREMAVAAVKGVDGFEDDKLDIIRALNASPLKTK